MGNGLLVMIRFNLTQSLSVNWAFLGMVNEQSEQNLPSGISKQAFLIILLHNP